MTRPEPQDTSAEDAGTGASAAHREQAASRRARRELGAAILADAEAERALGRAAAALGVGALALAVLALLFLVLTERGQAASWVPQAVVLGVAQLAGLTVAVRLSLLVARLRNAADAGEAGHGPAFARQGARWLGGLLTGVPPLSAGAVVVLAVTLRPLPTTLLSAAVALAIVAQLLLLAVVQRAGLRRAGRQSIAGA